jgi:hypothetical protein
MSARAFARVDGFGNLLAHSPEVLGMAHCLDSPSQTQITFGAYCFKLNFTPVCVMPTLSHTPLTRRLGQSFIPPVQTSLDNSRRTIVDVALNAPPASKMQP